jgi:enoyl-CoA hydratase/carnithine racemase
VVLLTGTGDEFVGPRTDVAEGQFGGMSERCSGANSPSAILAGVADAREMQNALLDIAVPVVCAVNGPVLRHCEPALCADVIVASEDASFEDSAHFALQGLVSGDGTAIISAMLMGVNRARSFLLTGEVIDAAEALRLGMVTEVLPKDQVFERAHEMARKLATKSDAALRNVRALLTYAIKKQVLELATLGFQLETTAMFVSREGRAPALRERDNCRHPAGSEIAAIGLVAEGGGALTSNAILYRSLLMRGLVIGPKVNFGSLLAAMAVGQRRPVIDSVFLLEEYKPYTAIPRAALTLARSLSALSDCLISVTLVQILPSPSTSSPAAPDRLGRSAGEVRGLEQHEPDRVSAATTLRAGAARLRDVLGAARALVDRVLGHLAGHPHAQANEHDDRLLARCVGRHRDRLHEPTEEQWWVGRDDAGAALPRCPLLGLPQPLLGVVLGRHFAKKQGLGRIVEGSVCPTADAPIDAKSGTAGKDGTPELVEVGYPQDVRHDDRGHRKKRTRRRLQLQLLGHLPGEDRREVLDPHVIEPLEHCRRGQIVPQRATIAHPDGEQEPVGLFDGTMQYHPMCAEAAESFRVSDRGPRAVEILDGEVDCQHQ